MNDQSDNGFTLLELLIVVLISAVVAMTVSLYLQKSVSAFKGTDEQSELAGRVKYCFERLRKCTRHSLSTLCNFQVITALAANHPIDQTETLFFVTDFDQDLTSEAHFVWFDRTDTANPNCKYQRLLHVWQEPAKIAAGASLAAGTFMPPDMGAATFLTLIDYLRKPSNFNGGGPPSVREGFEILFEAPYPRAASLPASVPAVSATSLPIYIGRWIAPPVSPGSSAYTPGSGIAFNIAFEMAVTPGSPPTFMYLPTAAPIAGRNSIFNILCNTTGDPWGLYTPEAYSKPAAGTPLGSPHCQVYLNAYVDENRNSVPETQEPSIQLLTSLNLLLIPSAGRTAP